MTEVFEEFVCRSWSGARLFELTDSNVPFRLGADEPRATQVHSGGPELGAQLEGAARDLVSPRAGCEAWGGNFDDVINFGIRFAAISFHSAPHKAADK